MVHAPCVVHEHDTAQHKKSRRQPLGGSLAGSSVERTFEARVRDEGDGDGGDEGGQRCSARELERAARQARHHPRHTKAKRLLLGFKQSPAIAGLRGRRARRARTLRVSKDTPDGTCDMTAAVACTMRRAHGQCGTAAATVKPVASRPRRLVGRGEKLGGQNPTFSEF